MKKLMQAKYMIILAIVCMSMMYVLFSLMSTFYMGRGYTIPMIFLIVISVVLIQKPDREGHQF